MMRISRATILISSSAVVAVTWKILQWRARKRARKIVRQVRDYMKDDGPLIDYNDPAVRERILTTAIKRASKWMALAQQAKPMVGQVGGINSNKKPLLTLAPDYVLKPVITDHRGIREIAFYEAIRTLTQSKHVQHAYSTFLTGRERQTSKHVGELIDTVAMALAIFLRDQIVLDSEVALRDAWRGLKREVDMIRQLAKFSPPYYGVMGLSLVDASMPFGVTEDAHLLLQDLTVNFSKPCVMDLKMGVQTYEPDATPEKRAREYGKYPQQTQFGFRIVGMRFYDPSHPDSDAKGFRYFQKPYGRSLTTRDQLLEAFRMFFSAGIEEPPHVEDDATSHPQDLAVTDISGTNGMSKRKRQQRASTSATIRTRTISNLLVQLRPLRRWFEENKSLCFYASSLLIVYEGDANGSNVDMTNLKMIDFGRVRRQAGGDQGYITGLSMLKNIFAELLREEEQRIRDTQS